MKRLFTVFAALPLLLAGVAPSAASADPNAVEADGSGAVTIFTPLTLTETQALGFGTVISGLDGTVSIDALTGARTVDGGVTAILKDVGRPGAFAITGEPDAVIQVMVGEVISGFGAGITGTTRPSPLPTALSGKTAAFAVGGTLAIPAHTKAGVYTGTYPVAVNYP